MFGIGVVGGVRRGAVKQRVKVQVLGMSVRRNWQCRGGEKYVEGEVWR